VGCRTKNEGGGGGCMWQHLFSDRRHNNTLMWHSMAHFQTDSKSTKTLVHRRQKCCRCTGKSQSSLCILIAVKIRYNTYVTNPRIYRIYHIGFKYGDTCCLSPAQLGFRSVPGLQLRWLPMTGPSVALDAPSVSLPLTIPPTHDNRNRCVHLILISIYGSLSTVHSSGSSQLLAMGI